MRVLLIAIWLVVLSSTRKSTYPEGFWPLDIFGEFSGEQERILTYFDFNRDRFVDMITQTTSDSGNEMILYLWNTHE